MISAEGPIALSLCLRPGPEADAARSVLVDKANAVAAFDSGPALARWPGNCQTCTDHAYIDAACMWMVKNLGSTPSTSNVSATS
jgi:hypothetical protein